jgi:hypothetical protein
VAAKRIGTILRRAPDIIEAAGSLLARRGDKRSAEGSAARTESQLSEIQSRLSELESRDQDAAEVVNPIAQQTRDITIEMEVLAAQARLLTDFLAATLIIAATAIATAVSAH